MQYNDLSCRTRGFRFSKAAFFSMFSDKFSNLKNCEIIVKSKMRSLKICMSKLFTSSQLFPGSPPGLLLFHHFPHNDCPRCSLIHIEKQLVIQKFSIMEAQNFVYKCSYLFCFPRVSSSNCEDMLLSLPTKENLSNKQID